MLIYAVWQDSTAAENTLKHMSKGAKDQIAAYAVLVKDKDGNVDTRLRHHKTGGFSGVQSSQTIDSAIARLSESAPDSASGYAPNPPTTRLSEKDLKKVRDMFGPGESVLLLMSPKPAISEIQRALGAGAVLFRSRPSAFASVSAASFKIVRVRVPPVAVTASRRFLGQFDQPLADVGDLRLEHRVGIVP